MTWQMFVVFGLLTASFALMVWEKLSLDLVAAIVAIASPMTSFLSDNAVAVLLTPIVIQAAASLHVSARPFIIAVAIGASACFATPIGYQTNTLICGAGGYRFRDFIKVGLPLNLVFCALAVYFLPKCRPF
jgi:di/tricarboxylate transporter